MSIEGGLPEHLNTLFTFKNFFHRRITFNKGKPPVFRIDSVVLSHVTPAFFYHLNAAHNSNISAEIKNLKIILHRIFA